jgi:hypothetical protein
VADENISRNDLYMAAIVGLVLVAVVFSVGSCSIQRTKACMTAKVELAKNPTSAALAGTMACASM